MTANLNLNRLDAIERADLFRATYFVLEAYYDGRDGPALSSIEEADDCGAFAIHIGLPNRPPRRYAMNFQSLTPAMLTLEDLKHLLPAAEIWLSCEEILTEIKGDDLWAGLVMARAEDEPDDPDDDWNAFASAIAAQDVHSVLRMGFHLTLDAIASRILAASSDEAASA